MIILVRVVCRLGDPSESPPSGVSSRGDVGFLSSPRGFIQLPFWEGAHPIRHRYGLAVSRLSRRAVFLGPILPRDRSCEEKGVDGLPASAARPNFP